MGSMRRLIVFFVLVAAASARVGEVQTRHRKLFVADLGRAITGRYIVALNPKVDNVFEVANSLVENTGASIEYEYDGAFKGFAVSGLVAAFLDLLLNDDIVEYIEEDQYVAEDQSIISQNSPSNWALDRIDSKTLPMNNKYQYLYTGKGVTIFVLDTGVNLNHVEYSGRVQCGYSVISGEDCTDFRGHGSHVTGIAAGSSVGVAKDASIFSVKVLDKNGNGSVSGVIAGVNFVTKQKQYNPSKPMVANMSLGGSRSTSINNAVEAAIATGVVVVTSAGNDSSYACSKSPASSQNVITIAAVNSDDSRGGYSNFGVCVDLFAPGTNIYSSWFSSSNAYRTLTGTSMATPVATGVAALYLEKNPSLTPAEVKSLMISNGAVGVVSDAGDGSPNVMLTTANLLSSSTVSSNPGKGNEGTAPAPTPVKSGGTCSMILSPCDRNNHNCCGSCSFLGLCFF